jgi:DNA polymerase-1
MMTGRVDNSKYVCKHKVIQGVSELADLVTMCKKDGFVAFDTESRGLPWSREPITCFSFSCGIGKTYVLPYYQHSPEADPQTGWNLRPYWSKDDRDGICLLLKELFEDASIAKGAHNLKYDMNALRFWFNIRVKGFTFDSMLMHHLLLEQKPHGLEYLADLEFGTGNYSEALHEIVGKGKVLKAQYDMIPDHILWPYAANDAEVCWKLVKIYHERLLAKPHLWQLYLDEVEPLTYTLADAEWHGHYINQDTVEALKDFYTDKRDNLLENMQAQVHCNFNPSSNPQVQAALIELGFKDKIRNPMKASGYSTSADVLRALAKDSNCVLATQILEYRNVIKMLGTYIENVRSDIDKDSRVRYNWMIHGTESGRLSCRFYHQLPRVDKQQALNLRDMLAA